jgi:hypothetical protein
MKGVAYLCRIISSTYLVIEGNTNDWTDCPFERLAERIYGDVYRLDVDEMKSEPTYTYSSSNTRRRSAPHSQLQTSSFPRHPPQPSSTPSLPSLSAFPDPKTLENKYKYPSPQTENTCSFPKSLIQASERMPRA